MSIIPEIIIQKILVNGIRDLRNNPWKVKQLFKSTPQNFNDQFSELLNSTPIDVTINYPREDSQFPCIAILLRSEEEAHTFLGDILSSGYDEPSGLLGSEDFFFTPNESSSEDALDNNGVFGEPSKIFNSDVAQFKENRGSGFNSSYMLQIMTDDQDFTIFLYHSVRSVILGNIKNFIYNGMHNMRLSGTDFLPQSSQQPNFIFMRGINLSFTYFPSQFIVLSDEEKVAKSFVLDINANDKSYLALAQKPVIESISVSSGSAGDSITGVSIKGYNFQRGASLIIYNPTRVGSESEISITNLKLKSSKEDTLYVSGLAGQSNSTTLEYKAVSVEEIPATVVKDTFLKVLGPSSHAAVGEQRRIYSATTGLGGSIKVLNAFSSSLAGAQVEVIKESGEITFDMGISATTPVGYKDVKLTNPDLIEYTLEKGFNVV